MSAAVAAAATAAIISSSSRNSSSKTNNHTYDLCSDTDNYRYRYGYGLFELFPPTPPKTFRMSKYELQMRRDLSAFRQYLYRQHQRRPLTIASCSGEDVVDFLRSLDESEETYKVHYETCVFFGNLRPPKCTCRCPQKPTWYTIDHLVRRMCAEFIKNGGSPTKNPFRENDVWMYIAKKRAGKSSVKTSKTMF